MAAVRMLVPASKTLRREIGTTAVCHEGINDLAHEDLHTAIVAVLHIGGRPQLTTQPRAIAFKSSIYTKQ